MTKFYVDAGGKYLGGFDGAVPPAGAIEVSFAPDHALDTWDGTKYVPHPPTAEERKQEEKRKAIERLTGNPQKLITAQDLLDVI